MKTVAVIVAAGSGIRAGAASPKQYLKIGGRPVLRRTAEVFLTHPSISDVICVIGDGHDAAYAEATRGLAMAEPVQGGTTRQESCRNGIEAAARFAPDLILIHDAARPFISHEVINRVIQGLASSEAVIPGLAVTDTLKRAPVGMIDGTVDRQALFSVQTPQGFHYGKIRTAHQALADSGRKDLTDDAAVAEAHGMKVLIVPGEIANKKLTTNADIVAADAALSSAGLWDLRIGQGVDFHTFSKGKSLWLCGVEIPHSHSLKGHSDADVALHALTDAMLGAMGDGDIGMHFPPSDPQWKGARSSIFVAKAVDLLAARGGVLNNVDITILAEAPKIAPHIPAMKAELARQLGIDTSRIAIKATTTEKMGAIGRKEGMAAYASVALRLPHDG